MLKHEKLEDFEKYSKSSTSAAYLVILAVVLQHGRNEREDDGESQQVYQ